MPADPQLIAAMQQLATEFRKIAQQQSQSMKAASDFARHTQDAADDIENLSKSVKKHHKLTANEIALQEQFAKARKKEAQLLAEEAKLREKLKEAASEFKRSGAARGTPEHNNHRANQRSIADNIKRLQSASSAERAKSEEASAAFRKSVGSTSRGLDLLVGFLAKAGSALLEFNQTFMKASTSSAGVIEETTGNFDQGMGHLLATLSATGVEASKVIGLMAENRQMVNAVGGIRGAIGAAEDSILSMRGYYGSLEDSMRGNLHVMTEFASKGVKPSTASMAAYNRDLDMLAKQTGLSATAINALVDSVANDTESMSILKAARADEREAILANQRALIKSNIALGMTAQQAAEAAKMLNKMVAQKPLDRLKQAAKMRAMGAAMGLGNEANAAAEGVIAGKRATAEQRAAISDFSVKMTGMVDQSAQAGLGQELFVSTMLDKLDLDQYYGSGSAFSTTLGDVLQKSQTDVNAMYKSSSDSVIVKINNVADIAMEMLTALLNGNMLFGALLDTTRLANGIVSDFFGDQAAEFKDFTSALHNIGEDIKGLFPGSGEKHYERTDRVAAREATRDYNSEIAKLKKEANQQSPAADALVKERETKRVADEEKAKKEANSQAKIKLDQLKTGASTNAIPVSNLNIPTVEQPTVAPNTKELPTVRVVPDPARDKAVETASSKSSELQSDQIALMSQHSTKIDEQLKQMTNSNEYLKVIADTNPKLLEVAEKQLAVSTMSQEQRDRVASRLRTESSKFNSDYSYAS